MEKAGVEIIAEIVVLITLIDFISDALFEENIVSVIRKMIKKTDNTFEAVKSQKRVTYFSILFKLVFLCLLVFSAVFLNLSLIELTLYILAMSIFIANIIILLTRPTT